jgi:quercetin dioxygenase-like cupin family protein
MSDSYFTGKAEVEPLEQLPGIHRRTMGMTDKGMLCEFFLERGYEVPTHTHPQDQVGYVISGELEMTIDGEVRICRAGDSYAIPGDVVHGARILADTLAIDVFSPPREDYMTENDSD